MNNKHGFTIIELVVLIGVLGVISIAFFVKTSYAFVNNNDEYYDNLIHLTLEQAKLYGKTSEELQKNKIEIISINSLVEKGFVRANDEGKVIDPRNNNNDLNNLKIKLTYENEEIIATIDN